MTVLIVAAVVMPPLVRAQPHHVQGQVEGPMFHTLAEAYKYRVEHKDQPVVPQGVNDPDCRVTPQHKQAVVLVHGTDTTMYADYSQLGAAIAQAGWCTYGFDYGAGPAPDKGFGWAPIEQSAAQLDQTVAAARRSSGAESVVFVGFSQGATVARYWMHSDPAHAAATHKWIVAHAGREFLWVGAPCPDVSVAARRGGELWFALARVERADDGFGIQPALEHPSRNGSWCSARDHFHAV